MIVNLSQVLTALCVPILTGTWAAIWRMYRRYQSTQDGMKCLLSALPSGNSSLIFSPRAVEMRRTLICF